MTGKSKTISSRAINSQIQVNTSLVKWRIQIILIFTACSFSPRGNSILADKHLWHGPAMKNWGSGSFSESPDEKCSKSWQKCQQLPGHTLQRYISYMDNGGQLKMWKNVQFSPRIQQKLFWHQLAHMHSFGSVLKLFEIFSDLRLSIIFIF